MRCTYHSRSVLRGRKGRWTILRFRSAWANPPGTRVARLGPLPRNSRRTFHPASKAFASALAGIYAQLALPGHHEQAEGIVAIPDRQHYALQTIFSFFLGLMALASIGVGVNTFYPAPDEKFNLKMRELNRRQESIRRMEAPGSFGPIERARLDSLAVAQDALSDQEQSEMKDWARVTSIVLVLFATLVLVISLGLNERLRVISNGLLLGGLFTMIYGVGWVIFSGNSVARFCVIVFALAVSVGLGYAKFVRGKRQPAARG